MLWSAAWSARNSGWRCGSPRSWSAPSAQSCCSIAVFPELAAVTVLGVRLNWLVLAVLGYPFLYGVGRLYVRLAEQAERDFVGVVESEP